MVPQSSGHGVPQLSTVLRLGVRPSLMVNAALDVILLIVCSLIISMK